VRCVYGAVGAASLDGGAAAVEQLMEAGAMVGLYKFRAYGLWFMVYGLWFMVHGLGFKTLMSLKPPGLKSLEPLK
jgi:hypothetical protein